MPHISSAFIREKTRNQTTTFIILFLSLVIGFFFLQDQYSRYMSNQDILSNVRAENVKKEKILSSLNDLKKRISNDPVLKDSLERFAGTFREDAIIDSIFAPKQNISVSEISIGRGDRLPSGLSMADISVSFRSGDTRSLLGFLDYLTNQPENKRSYIIKSLNYPLDTTSDGPQNVSLDLGMYYFDTKK